MIMNNIQVEKSLQESLDSFLIKVSKKYNISICDIYETLKRCPYVFSKGIKKGLECGVKINNKNSQYCSLHKPKNQEDDTVIVARFVPSIQRFVHKISGLVFFSKDIKEVYGKLKKDQIINLTHEDIELCKKYKFKIYTGLL
jgi:hypothetical protein